MLVVRPPRGLASLNLHEVIEYWEIVQTFALREVKLRYRQTALGVIWVVLQPLITAGIATFIFGVVAGFGKKDPHYFATAFAGQLAWTVFGLSIVKISTSLVGNAPMLSKVFFPRLTLPIASVVAAQMDFLVSLVLMFLLMPLFHVVPTLAILTLPLWVGVLALFGLGVGMMAAALMVSYRDIGFVLPVVLQSLLFLSPVNWPLATLNQHVGSPLLRSLYFGINPVAPLIEGVRWSLLGGTYSVPTPWLIYSVCVALLVCFLGTIVFRTEERRFADVV